MPQSRRLPWLLLCVSLLLVDGSRGDEPVQAPKDAPDRAQVERLIKQLGSSDFKERESATQQLKKTGPAALDRLRAAANESDDAETRRRAANLVEEIENRLDQLLIEYRSLGLPLPPKDAPLVRFEAGGGGLVNGKVQPTQYDLAFLIKRGNSTEPWILLVGVREQAEEWDPKPQEVKPESANDNVGGRGGLMFAIQCQARGWGKLAEEFVARSRREGLTPHRQLIQRAWFYWEDQLTLPTGDRKPIARRLNELIRRDTELDNKPNRALIKSLELALVPSKAKPGSVEALIDGLVDYSANPGTIGSFKPENQYWRIAELGFDAVPALIEHLDDDRLTRGMMQGFNNFRSFHLRVSPIAAEPQPKGFLLRSYRFAR